MLKFRKFHKHFLNSRYEYANEWGDDVIASQFSNIWRIRKYLTQQATEQIVHSFVTCRLDMCNSLYTGLPKNQISRLQRIQNMAARLVTIRKRSDSISPILKSLHWLPVSKRIVL